MIAIQPFNTPVLVKPDKTMTEVFPADGKAFTLEEYYKHVECTTVELVTLPNGVQMWCDENGKLTGKKINPIATFLWKVTFAGYELGGDDFCVGNILYVPKEYQEKE